MSTQTGSDLAQAHIAANTRVQQVAAAAAFTAWISLGSYDEEDVPTFLGRVVPVVLAAQRQTVALTVAYVGRTIRRRVVAPDVNTVTGAAIRTATPEVIEASQRGGLALAPNAIGVPPEVVYRRPFVETWSGLAAGKPWRDAVVAAGDRVASTAAMDVQNAMRHTLRAVGEREDLILGYRRVPDADACPFCKLIAGRRYLTSDLMEVHPRCACGVDVITAENRDEFTGKRKNDLAISSDVRATVVQHGELGPLLVSADHDITVLAA